ncbi:hypothetical protein ACJZ2D_006481 [Fusarium nematophilum]
MGLNQGVCTAPAPSSVLAFQNIEVSATPTNFQESKSQPKVKTARRFLAPRMCWKTIMWTVCSYCDYKWERQITQQPCEDAVTMARYGICNMGVHLRDAEQPAECGSCRRARRAREKGKGKATDDNGKGKAVDDDAASDNTEVRR